MKRFKIESTVFNDDGDGDGHVEPEKLPRLFFHLSNTCIRI